MSADERRSLLNTPAYCDECGSLVTIYEGKYGAIKVKPCEYCAKKSQKLDDPVYELADPYKMIFGI